MDEFEVGQAYTLRRGGEIGQWVFKGGDPSDSTSWSKAGSEDAAAPATRQVDRLRDAIPAAFQAFLDARLPTRRRDTAEDREMVRGGIREMAQGMTLGGADEVEAAFRPGVSLDDVNARREEYRASGGPTAIPQLIGAALLPGMGTFNIGKQLLGSAGAARTAVGLAAIGGAEGAVTGALSSDPGQRGRGAVTGGAIGTGLGLGLPALAGGGVAMARLIKELGNPDVQGIARRELADVVSPALPGAVAREGDTAADALGVQGQLAGRRALADQPENLPRVVDKLEAREGVNLAEITNAVDRITDTPAAIGRREFKDQLVLDRQTKAGEIYSRLHRANNPVPPRVAGLVTKLEADDSTRALVADVRQAMDLNEGISVELADRVERNLSAKVNASYRTAEPAQAIKRTRDELREALTEVPEYAQARQMYAGDKAVEEAAKMGASWQRESVKDLEYIRRTMSDAEWQAYTFNAATDIESVVETRLLSGPVAAVRWLRGKRSRLEKMFGDDAAGVFFGEIDRIATQSQGLQRAQSGVEGAARGGVVRDQNATNVLTAIGYALNSMWGAAGRTGIQTTVRSPQIQRRIANEVTDLMYLQDPTQVINMLKGVAPRVQQQAQNVGGLQALISGIGGYTGGSTAGNR